MNAARLPDEWTHRIHGPLESFYDKTWKPGDPEPVK